MLICRVGAMNKAGLLLNVLCFGGTTRKSRLVHDLRLRCFCPAEETVPPTEPPGRRSYDKDDVVATVVLEVRRDSQRLLVSMKAENLRDESQRDTVRLGSAGRLGVGVPGRYLLTKEAERDDLSYSECLERSAEHINPSCVENMARDLGLPFAGGACSLFDTLRCGFQENEKAPTLRKQQVNILLLAQYCFPKNLSFRTPNGRLATLPLASATSRRATTWRHSSA